MKFLWCITLYAKGKEHEVAKVHKRDRKMGLMEDQFKNDWKKGKSGSNSSTRARAMRAAIDPPHMQISTYVGVNGRTDILPDYVQVFYNADASVRGYRRFRFSGNPEKKLVLVCWTGPRGLPQSINLPVRGEVIHVTKPIEVGTALVEAEAGETPSLPKTQSFEIIGAKYSSDFRVAELDVRFY